MAIRLCHVTDFEAGFFQLEDAKEATFTGSSSYVVNGLIEKAKSAMNLSIIVNRGNGVGQQSNESYNGCFGQLERNESDLVLSAVEYPSSNMNIDQGMVLFETTMVFMQNYFFTDFKENDVQVLSSLVSLFDITHLILSFYATCVLVLVIAEKMVTRWSKRPQRQQLLSNVLLHCTRLGSIRDNSSPGYRIMFSTLSIFSLVVVHYYLSSIKSDLVVVEDPEIWRSYDDLMKDGVRPMTVREFKFHSYLKSAHPSTGESKFWNWAVDNFGEEALVRSSNPTSFIEFGNYMLYRRGVAFYDEIVSKMIRVTGCNSLGHSIPSMGDPEKDYRFSNYNLLLTKDPNAEILTRGMVFSRHFTGPLGLKVRSIVRSWIEFGFVKYFLNFIEKVDLMDGLRPRKHATSDAGNKLDAVANCKSDYLVRPQRHHTDAIGLKNIRTLALVYSCLVIVCNSILLIEVAAPKIILGLGKQKERKSTPKGKD